MLFDLAFRFLFQLKKPFELGSFWSDSYGYGVLVYILCVCVSSDQCYYYRKVYILIRIIGIVRKMEYVKKTITITKKQAKWISDNSINLSRLVQKTIEQKNKKK